MLVATFHFRTFALSTKARAAFPKHSSAFSTIPPMENLDFGLAVFIPILLMGIAQSIPSLIITVGGVMAIRKGYIKSGSAILVSCIVSFISHFGWVFLQRLVGYEPMTIYSYVMQGIGFIGGSFLAAGIIGIVKSLRDETGAQ